MKKLKEELKYGKKGITLISLVVTIIVLLILAAVSIATLTGPNGLLTRANQAKEATEQATEKEGVGLALTTVQIGENGYKELKQLNLQNAIDSQFGINKAIVTDNGDGTFTVSFIDSKRDYNITSNGVENGIDWNKAMQNAKAPESQDDERNNGVIGIGTDGNPVDMDLWQYTLLDDGTYCLNDEKSQGNIASISDITPGYTGGFTDNGELLTKIPQYISANGSEFKAVTQMEHTFFGMTQLQRIKNIPITVTDLRGTFYKCSALQECGSLPNNVTTMEGTFFECSELLEIKNIPLKLINMMNTFLGCKKIVNCPKIPDSVVNMQGTFKSCESLQNITNLPKYVVNMDTTFQYCKMLKSIENIPNFVENLKGTFFGCLNLEHVGVIPESVNVLYMTFWDCTRLQGTLIINSENVINFSNCFHNTSTIGGIKLSVKGSCQQLNDIIETKSSNSNIYNGNI